MKPIIQNTTAWHKRFSLLILTLLLFNPVIIFIVTKSVVLGIIIPVIGAVLVQWLYTSQKFKPFAVWALNLSFVLSLFVHAEAVFNTAFKEYIIEDLYDLRGTYYFNQPFLDKVFKDKEFIVNYKTNKQGFRIGHEDDPEVELNQVDWLFLGDSYTQGAQVQYEELYTNLIYQKFPNKIIVNAGISGFGLPDEYNYYMNEGRRLKPKKVFLQVCNFNDFMKVEEKKSGFSDYLMHYSNFLRFLLYDFKYSNPAELPLGRWTEPFYPDEESNSNYNIFYTETSPAKKRDIIKFCYYLSKLNEAVQEDGAELIVIQIPTKEQLYFKFFEEVVSSFKIDVSKLDMDLPNKILEEECKKASIKLIDLRDKFSDGGENVFYQYDEHLTVLGHKLLAKAVCDMLQKTEPRVNMPDILSANNAGDRYPVMTDSGHIFFQSFRHGNSELFISDSLLGNVRRVTFNNVDEIHPWPSQRINKVVFTEGNQALNRTKVVMMDFNGSGRQYITADECTFGSIPSISSDGWKVAYAEWICDGKEGRFTNPQIVVLDLLTNQKQLITADTYESWRPVFSPSAESIYYISKENNSFFDVFKYDLLLKKELQITYTGYDEWDPAISRDGKYLTYAGKKDGNWDLFLINLLNGQVTQLTNSLGNEWDPCFSFSGKELYFSATFGFRNGIFKMGLK